MSIIGIKISKYRIIGIKKVKYGGGGFQRGVDYRNIGIRNSKCQIIGIKKSNIDKPE